MTSIIDVRSLTVELTGTEVLTAVDLTVGVGEVVALVGANGAGKSTLLRCLAGLQAPTSGRVEVLGAPPADAPAFWREVAFVADEPAWYPGLTAAEHLELTAAVHPCPRLEVATAIEQFGLGDRVDAPPQNLSSGQRQRLSLAAAFLRPSRLLLLDEPERALDADFRARLATMIEHYAHDGGTVVMATHAPTTNARHLTLTAGQAVR